VASNLQGPQNFRLALPPPVERHVKLLLAHDEQNVLGSAVPASGAAAMSALSQLRKQYMAPVDSYDAQTSLNPVMHSPGVAQQSASVVHVCVQ
jgi:hypothetical protein